MFILKLAWRNIWRKKRRTIIVIISVFFAVFLSILSRSMAWGGYNDMIDLVVRNTGHIQVQFPTYNEDKSINKLIPDEESFRTFLADNADILTFVGILENGALAIGEKDSKPVFLLGLDTSKEIERDFLEKKIVKGTYFTGGSKEVILTEGLAKFLSLKVGDQVAFLAQGYRGSTGADNLTIVGIAKIINPLLNSQLAYLPLGDAQFISDAPKLLTGYKVVLKNHQDIAKVKEEIKNYFTSQNVSRDVLDYNELQKELKQQIESDSLFNYFLLLIIYLIMGFGILATLLTMVLERKKELAVLNALGLKKQEINKMILLEAVLMGIGGVLISLLLTVPVIAYLNQNPIPITDPSISKGIESYGLEPFIKFAIQGDIFYYQVVIVFFIVFLCSLLPRFIVNKIDLSSTLKN